MSNNNLNQYLESNWDKLQDKVQKEWDLSDEDVEKIEGSYDKLVAKIKEQYGYTEKQIKDSLSTFIESSGIKNLKNKVVQVKDKAEKVLQDSYEDAKEKTSELQDNITSYIKENPFKAVGMAFVGAMVLSKIFKK